MYCRSSKGSTELLLALRSSSCNNEVIGQIERISYNEKNMIDANLSQNILTLHDVKELCSAVENNTHLRNLNLSGCITNQEHFRFIANALCNNSSIISLHISDNDCTSETIGLFAEPLKSNVHLLSIDFGEPKRREKYEFEEAKGGLAPLFSANKQLFVDIEHECPELCLSNRGISFLSHTISSLTHLTSLNLSHNRLRDFSFPLKWNSLLFLDLSHNQLISLPKSFIALTSLEVLNLSNNHLKEASILLSLMKNLKSIDLSYNWIVHLNHVPLCSLSKHSNLTSINLKGNPFVKASFKILSKSAINGKPEDTYKAMKALNLTQQNIGRAKIFFLCAEENESYQCPLVQLLTQRKKTVANFSNPLCPRVSRSEIFKETPWRAVYYDHKSKKKVRNHIDFLCYEWNQFDPTFQLLLSPNAIYVLSVSIPISEEKIIRIKQYLDIINTILLDISPNNILVVLSVPELIKKKTIEEIISELRSHLPIRTVVPVCGKTGKGIKILSSLLVRSACTLPLCSKSVPTSFRLLEENIKSFKLSNSYHPIVSPAQLTQFLEESGIKASEKDRSLQYLHDKGTIIHWNTEYLSFSNYIMLDYMLISQLFERLKDHYNKTKNIILEIDSLELIWKGYGEETRKRATCFLQRFEILAQTSEPSCVLIPSLIPYEIPDIYHSLPKEHKRNVWRKIYKFSALPSNIFSRLSVALLRIFPEIVMWKLGFLFTIRNERGGKKEEIGLVEFNPLTNQIMFQIPIAWPPYYLSQVGTFIEEIVAHYKEYTFQVAVPCVHCIKRKVPIDKAHHFSIIELSNHMEKKISTITCTANPNKPVHVSIPALAPDASIQKVHLLVRKEDITLGEVIGCGTYGRVYKALYGNITVAAKVLNKIDSNSDRDRLFSEFRREVQLMSELQDPHLIRLCGVASIPDFCVVQEYCPAGDLHHFLGSYYKKYGSAPPFWYSIQVAYNIAQGMEYLHSCSPPVLHRDLKSPNVLLIRTVSQLEPEKRFNGVVAKITDFGLSSQCNLPYSSRVVDNPLWLAPELMEQAPYTRKVDVYSFGIILWELLSGQVPFAEFHIPYDWKLEEEIRTNDLRPTIAPKMSPDCTLLMRACWHKDPLQRPCFKEIVATLHTILVDNELASDFSLEFSSSVLDLEILSDGQASDAAPLSRRRTRLDRSYFGKIGASNV